MFVGTLVFSTPLFVLMNEREQHKFTTVLASDFENVDKLLKDMRAGSDSENTWTLVWTVLLPLFDALFAEVVPTVVTFHRTLQYF